ncbi:hypothetical protein J6590_070399 [Homalodisca vitripennis]|nr:hypothetical protein J6590_070399 [Homalodisca vitripennis]
MEVLHLPAELASEALTSQDKTCRGSYGSVGGMKGFLFMFFASASTQRLRCCSPLEAPAINNLSAGNIILALPLTSTTIDHHPGIFSKVNQQQRIVAVVPKEKTRIAGSTRTSHKIKSKNQAQGASISLQVGQEKKHCGECTMNIYRSARTIMACS